MLYTIYHPIGGYMNHNCRKGQYNYEEVATVEAYSLDGAFQIGQNFNEEYAKLGIRSTSVGDIIADEEGDFFMVRGTGFERITPTGIKRSSDITLKDLLSGNVSIEQIEGVIEEVDPSIDPELKRAVAYKIGNKTPWYDDKEGSWEQVGRKIMRSLNR